MQFMVQYEFGVAQREAAEARFLETGAQPPEGVTLLGRWHDVAGRKGYMVVEADDATRIAAYMRSWTDLLTFGLTPVVSDEQIAQVIREG